MKSILAALAVLFGFSLKEKPKRPPPHECQPYAETCTACKDCSACKHCHGLGGKCSVCWGKTMRR